MTRVVICEKPKQAQAVRAAIGMRFGRIMAARGHVLRLQEPHEIRPEWSIWGFDVLAPQGGATYFDTVPAEDTKELFEELKAAIEGASSVIIATDCDREGEMIGREIIDAVPGFSGKVRRAIYTALDEASIRAAFDNLRPARDFDRLYDAARARAALDQIQNLSLTRAMTVGYRPPGWKGPLGIGRVKTPLLGIICRHEDEITGFQERSFFDLRLDLDLQDGAAPLLLWWRGQGDGRLRDAAQARAVAEAGQAWSGPLAVSRERKRQGPPRLPHLTDLQKRAGAWGWSPDRTLAVAQAIYDEHKLTTYPRSECRHLPESQIAAAPAMLAALAEIDDFKGIAPSEPMARTGKSGHYCTAEVEKLSHDAIVPNVNMAAQFRTLHGDLSDDERKLFGLIARLWLAAISPDAVFDETRIATAEPATCDGVDYIFRATGRVEVAAGWRVVFHDGEGEKPDQDEAESALPDVADGDHADASACEAVARKTQRPRGFALAELPEAMETIWRFVDDPALGERLKQTRGIGTSATRGAIIEGMIAQGLIAVDGKRVRPTEMGMQMYRLLIKVAPSLVDPGETGKMEAALDAIIEGKVDPKAVVNAGIKRTGALIAALKAGAERHTLEVARPPTPKMIKAVRAVAKATGTRAPKDALGDFDAAKAFLETHGRGSGPTEPMKAAVQKIAGKNGSAPPPEALTDFDACKAFLEAQPVKKKPPSAKQLDLAEKLAQEKGDAIPDEARGDAQVLSKWIDAHRGGGRSPTSRTPRRRKPG